MIDEKDDEKKKGEKNNKSNPLTGDKIAILVRTIVLFLALVNQLLMVFGYSILPISEEEMSELCTALFTAVAAIWTWWSDNHFAE